MLNFYVFSTNGEQALSEKLTMAIKYFHYYLQSLKTSQFLKKYINSNTEALFRDEYLSMLNWFVVWNARMIRITLHWSIIHAENK